MRFVVITRELELGGAQRCTLDAAFALKKLGHEVRFLTSHHNPNYSYPESNDPSNFDVTVRGDFLPWFNCFGFYLRVMYLSAWLCFCSGWEYDVIYMDQFAYGIPIVKWFGRRKAPVVFYCHFPDKWICQPGWAHRVLCRWFWDRFEEWGTGKADVVLVNSKYTAGAFYKSYKSLQHMKVHLLHPCLNESLFDAPAQPPPEVSLDGIVPTKRLRSFFLYLGRFDDQKNIDLSIHALGHLKSRLSDSEFDRVHLVIAGAAHKRVATSTHCYRRLIKLADKLRLNSSITFVTTLSTQLKSALLSSCRALLFTPSNEHFGIVPLEAMYCERPVIAVRSGGPLETVAEGETGLMASVGNVAEFAGHMVTFLKNPAMADEFGKRGRKRVKELFSFDAFMKELDRIIKENIAL